MSMPEAGFWRRSWVSCFSAALMLGVAASGLARAQAVNAASVYPRSYFDRFSPRTALDMVERTPGFVLTEVTVARGLAAGAGNVLIDGRRPVAKSGGLAEVLGRIPASKVARIEVRRGASARGEAGGHALVVNVLRTGGGTTGSMSLEMERPPDPGLNLEGEVTFARPVGDWEVASKLRGKWERYNYLWYRRRTIEAGGALRQVQDEMSPELVGSVFLSLEGKRPLAGGVLTLNGRFGREVSFRDRDRTNFTSDARDVLLGTQRVGDDNAAIIAETSVEWSGRLPGGGWDMKAAAFGSWTDRSRDQFSDNFSPAGSRRRSDFRNDEEAIEGVGRVTIERAGKSDLTPELGLEVAFNRLDSRTAAGADFGPMSRESVAVSELRGEAFANAQWRATDRLRIEAGLAAEFSRIAVEGDRESEAALVYVKPNFAVNYAFREGVEGRIGLQRSVGQLAFADFAASANFADGRVLAGNAELRPDRTWRLAASLDLRTGDRGALNVEAYYERVEGALEQAPLDGSGAAGLANLGSGDRWGVNAGGAISLDKLIRGGRLEFNVKWTDSRFRDPLSGEVRTLNYIKPLAGSVKFRQDLPELHAAWGVRLDLRERDLLYFVDEAYRRYRAHRISAFVETTRFFGVKARLDIENIGRLRNGDTRFIYWPNRAAPVASAQISRRLEGECVRLTVSRQF